MSAARLRLARAAIVFLTIAALALCGAGLVDLLAGVEVRLVHNAKSEAEQEEWRRLRDARDNPAEIYGQPDGGPLRVVVWERERLIRPAELPGERLLVVDRAHGDVPLQSRTLWRYALTVAVPALGLALVLGWIARRRRARSEPGAPRAAQEAGDG